jgi:hypothetical protein
VVKYCEVLKDRRSAISVKFIFITIPFKLEYFDHVSVSEGNSGRCLTQNAQTSQFEKRPIFQTFVSFHIRFSRSFTIRISIIAPFP